jgi:hypothetical protein
MGVVGMAALLKAFWVKDLVLLLVGLVLVAFGIRGVRWWLYACRPDWNGAYWVPPRKREVTRLAFVVIPVVLLIAGSQSPSNNQQNAPWGVYAVFFLILAIVAFRWLRSGFKRLFRRSAS